MISVIVPTLDAEGSLGRTLAAFAPALADGLVGEIIVADAGSRDGTRELARLRGAQVLECERGRGRQLDTGAAAARAPWLMFLHADTVLEPDWEQAARSFIDDVDKTRRPPAAAAFRFALDDRGVRPRLIECGVALRCRLLRMPYGDQGLLIPAALYRELGGYRPLPLMEDVDLARRLGRSRIVMLPAQAITSAARYRQEGYARRVARNLLCLTLYRLRVPVDAITRLYG